MFQTDCPNSETTSKNGSRRLRTVKSKKILETLDQIKKHNLLAFASIISVKQETWNRLDRSTTMHFIMCRMSDAFDFQKDLACELYAVESLQQVNERLKTTWINRNWSCKIKWSLNKNETRLKLKSWKQKENSAVKREAIASVLGTLLVGTNYRQEVE